MAWRPKCACPRTSDAANPMRDYSVTRPQPASAPLAPAQGMTLFDVGWPALHRVAVGALRRLRHGGRASAGGMRREPLDEEELQVVLLDEQFRLLDGLALGQPYTPGVLSGLHPEGAHRIAFEFFADTRVVLKIHPQGELHVLRRLPPFARPLAGRFFSKHYLSLESVQAHA